MTRKFFKLLNEDKQILDENSFVYFVKLSGEKGLWTLIKALRQVTSGFNLKIIGDGDLRNGLEEWVVKESINNIRFFGYKTGMDLYDEIRRSMFTVIPSEWYENNPMSVLEAFALGKTGDRC